MSGGRHVNCSPFYRCSSWWSLVSSSVTVQTGLNTVKARAACTDICVSVAIVRLFEAGLGTRAAGRFQLHRRWRVQDKSVASTRFYRIRECRILHLTGIMPRHRQDCFNFLGCYFARGPEHSELWSNYRCSNLTVLNIINDWSKRTCKWLCSYIAFAA